MSYNICKHSRKAFDFSGMLLKTGIINMVKFVMILIVFIALSFLASCTAAPQYDLQPYAPPAIQEHVYIAHPLPSPTKPPPESGTELAEFDKKRQFIDTLIGNMSLEAQVSQLFILSLHTAFTYPSYDLERFISESEAGGYILFGNNITTFEGTRALTDSIIEFSALPPFIGIDEEGGTVSRLRGVPGYAPQPTAREVGASGDAINAYNAGSIIGEALLTIGVNVNFAPVADVLVNPQNRVIGSRSFGVDPDLVSDMVSAFQAGLHSQGIMSAPKHFPGHGSTAEDSHFGAAIIQSSLDNLSSVEYKPFIRAINEGAAFIMTGHIIAPEIDNLPATLSRYFITDVLRNALGFNGIIVTDAMNMGAITDYHTCADAAVMAILAGVDMILMPKDFDDAVSGILQALSDGTLPHARIHESLRRILSTKIAAGLIDFSY